MLPDTSYRQYDCSPMECIDLPFRPALVVHGPEAFDAGDVAYLRDLLAPSRILVAGVMARTAAEESGIPCEFCERPPSVVMSSLPGSFILVNRGKNSQSGKIFGEIVASRLGKRGLIHIECSSGTVYCWNPDEKNREISEKIAMKCGYVLEKQDVATIAPAPERRIRGCIPGEAVYINGIVIGHALSDEVRLGYDNGEIYAVSGIRIKPHGLEKLKRRAPVDLSSAWCKSGTIRTNMPKQAGRTRTAGYVLVIDHCGHELYGLMNGEVCGVLSIGDDTTAVCGHICSHLGVPVFGIVDGDGDGIVGAAFAPGSVVVEVRSERDDDVGNAIKPLVPREMTDWDLFCEKILLCLGDRVNISIRVT